MDKKVKSICYNYVVTMSKTIFKKIIPSLLIVIILSVGIFGAVGVEIANADVKDTIVDSAIKSNPFWYLFTLIKGGSNVVMEKSMTIVGHAMTMITGAILGISGVLLNESVNFTVLKMGENLKNDDVIAVGWKMFRDLANIIIIFALLVIGIATILRIEQYGIKKLLGVLIVVALLINFSMFFTKVVIDSSNLLAAQFYSMAEKEGTATWSVSDKKWTGIADSYQQAFKLTTIYNIKTKQVLTSNADGLEWYQILIASVLASILFLIAAFALFATSLLFIVRYIALIFLIILSPLAFVGMILPKTQNLASKWWSSLFNYSLFAPIFLLLTWFTIKFINSPAFQLGLGIKPESALGNINKEGVVAVETIPLILNFALAIGFIIGSLILAKQMGGYGSSAVMSWGKSARKWGQGVVGGVAFGGGGRLTRNTAGRGASKWADSEGLKRRAAEGGWKGFANRALLRTTRGVAGSSFDARATKAGGAIAKSASLGKAGGKGGYQEKLKQQVKAREKFAGSLVESKKTQAERVEERNIREQIRIAGDSLSTAQERIKDAKIHHPENSQQVMDAQRDLERTVQFKKSQDDALKAMQDRITKRGLDRQQQYADTLERESTIDTVFTKAPRKNKEASDAIRKSIKDAPNKKLLDELAKQMKANEGSAGETKEKPEESESSKTT